MSEEEKCIKEFEESFEFFKDKKNRKLIRKALEEKDKEIERLNKELEDLRKLNDANYKSFIETNKIIIEFEKFLKEEKTRKRYANDAERFTAYDFALKKLQELKGSDK